MFYTLQSFSCIKTLPHYYEFSYYVLNLKSLGTIRAQVKCSNQKELMHLWRDVSFLVMQIACPLMKSLPVVLLMLEAHYIKKETDTQLGYACPLVCLSLSL